MIAGSVTPTRLSAAFAGAELPTRPILQPMRGYDDRSYGDGFADVYDDWYSDVTDVEATVDRIAELAGQMAVCSNLVSAQVVSLCQ